MLASGVDHDVAAAQQRRVAGEAAAGDDPHPRHEARQPRERVEARHDEVEQLGGVGVARPPAAALGEQHDREAVALGQLQQPVGLAVVADPLRAGEDRVVVGEDRGARRLLAEVARVDRADAGDDPVARRPLDQLLEAAPRPLRRQRERAVLGERARVAQVRDVLARRAQPGRTALRDRLGSRRVVARQPPPLEHLSEVGAERVVGGRRAGSARARRASLAVRAARARAAAIPRGGQLHPEQRLPLRDLLADCDRQPPHDARRRRDHLVVHLHRLDHEHRRPRPHAVPLAHDHLGDHARQWRLDQHDGHCIPRESATRPDQAGDMHPKCD
jgi:hypothetical protein